MAGFSRQKKKDAKNQKRQSQSELNNGSTRERKDRKKQQLKQ